MSGWWRLKALFGGPGAKAGRRDAARKAAKGAGNAPGPALPSGARAALIRDAMAAHRAGRAHVRDVLERRLDDLRAKVPNPGRESDGAAHAQGPARDEAAVKRFMAHDLKRFLVLVGVRDLMDQAPAAPSARRPAAKR